MTTAPRCPDKPLRWAWRLILLSLAAAVLAVLTTGMLYIVISLGAWLPSAIALGLACVAAKRSSEPACKPEERPAKRHLWGALILASVLLAANLGSCRIAQIRARQAIVSSVSYANLRGIASALNQYAKDHGQAAPSLQGLIDSNAMAPSQFVALGDDSCEGYHDPCYRYQPIPTNAAGDRQLVVMYERGEWTSKTPRLFRELGRWVLFADGRLAVLSGAEFQQAMRQDAERRAALGLPAPQTQPARLRLPP